MELINLIVLLLMSAIALGICIKLVIKTLSVLAYPFYIGAYALEVIFPHRLLYMPKNGNPKYLMDFCAALCSTSILGVGYKLFMLFKDRKLSTINEAIGLQTLLSVPESIFFLISLTIIGIISYKNKRGDDDDVYDRINNLKTPKFFKILN